MNNSAWLQKADWVMRVLLVSIRHICCCERVCVCVYDRWNVVYIHAVIQGMNYVEQIYALTIRSEYSLNVGVDF